ncbi:Protein unc-93 A [Chamberlinius hualienensis]
MDVNFANGNKSKGGATFKNYGSVSMDNTGEDISNAAEYTKSLIVAETLNISEVKDQTWLKRRIWLNVALINLAVFFMTMGNVPVALFQSSLNPTKGLGVISLAAKNGFMIIGTILAPFFIKRFGLRLVMIIGALMYLTYIPANFYPSWFTLIPLATIAGLGCSLENVTHKIFLAKLAHLYADITQQDVDRVNSRLFVLMVTALKLSGSLSNFIASTIMNIGLDTDSNEGLTDFYNSTQLEFCGINYCNQMLSVTTTNDFPSEDTIVIDDLTRRYILIGFCTLCGITSVVTFSLVDPLKKVGIQPPPCLRENSPITAVKELLVAMKDPKHILFIPMAATINGGETFWSADYSKAFITCSIGMSYLGYVSVWQGISGAIASVILGWFNYKRIRCLPVISATLLQLTTLTALFYWTPSPYLLANYWSLVTFGIIFYFGMGIRHFISPVLVSVVFKDNLETGFSVFHFWLYFSSTLFYAWSNFLCMNAKIYILMTFGALCFIGYIGMELIVQRQWESKQEQKHLLTDDSTFKNKM